MPEVHSRSDRRGRAICAIAVVLALLSAVVGGWLYWDNTRFVTSHYTAEAPLREAADGFRIVQVSDLHTHSHGPHNRDLLAAIKAAKPDLIAITGDLISHDTSLDGIDEMVAFSSELGTIAPIFFVSGNHEVANPNADRLYAKLTDSGVHVLRNEVQARMINGTRVQIMGIDDPLQARSQGSNAATDQLVTQLITEAKSDKDYSLRSPTILLAHRPDAIDAYTASGVDVVFVGHNHGGQIRLPLLGGLVSPNRSVLPGLTSGVARTKTASVVISRGLGNSAIPVRVNNPFELVVVDVVPRK